MAMENERGVGLREYARDAARQRLADVAVDLFADHGFDAVTIGQIADRAGVSVRSVHRYFATKEDMVIGPFETNGPVVLDALQRRSADEPAMAALCAALTEMVEAGPDRPRDKAAMRLLGATPSVRARNVEKHLAWADLLTPAIASRLQGDDVDVRANALVLSALTAFTVALVAWADDPAGRTLTELLAVVFRDLIS